MQLEEQNPKGEWGTCACGRAKQKLSKVCNECWTSRGSTNKRKPCIHCGGEKGPGARRHLCDKCLATRGDRRRTTSDAYHREWRYQKLYGISIADYDQLLLAQEGVCAICSKECESGRRLAVDHCHSTGRVRGLLCIRCNQAIGRLEEDTDLLLKMKAYLDES